uniref:Uncharacterized protein n=1 Tax=Pseudonaja textilis TaxID=8673 RepID=A0A670XRA2_PSETE
VDRQKIILSPKKCNTENEIKARMCTVTCRECGYKIMYNKRTKCLDVFVAL